jgi:DNA-binding CsgD family transcriptional regulator
MPTPKHHKRIYKHHKRIYMKGVPLTPLEVNVLRLVAKGATNYEIGIELNYSEKTIEKMLGRTDPHYAIYPKIGVTNRSEASTWFTEAVAELHSRTRESPEAASQRLMDEIVESSQMDRLYRSGYILLDLLELADEEVQWYRFLAHQAKIARTKEAYQRSEFYNWIQSYNGFRCRTRRKWLEYTAFRMRKAYVDTIADKNKGLLEEEHEISVEHTPAIVVMKKLNLLNSSIANARGIPDNLLSRYSIYNRPPSVRSGLSSAITCIPLVFLGVCSKTLNLVEAILLPTKKLWFFTFLTRQFRRSRRVPRIVI